MPVRNFCKSSQNQTVTLLSLRGAGGHGGGHGVGLPHHPGCTAAPRWQGGQSALPDQGGRAHHGREHDVPHRHGAAGGCGAAGPDGAVGEAPTLRQMGIQSSPEPRAAFSQVRRSCIVAAKDAGLGADGEAGIAAIMGALPPPNRRTWAGLGGGPRDRACRPQATP